MRNDPVPEPAGEGIRPLVESRIKFSCHPGIACFNRCCADLHLVLTPYDVLRLKNALHLAAGEFLERYTEPVENGHSLFPLIRLRMSEGPGRPCPFVSPRGCTVYPDRPGACRLYPLGRAAGGAAPGGEERDFYFLVSESHCMGFREEREWPVEDWIRDQGVPQYNEMNRPWTEIVTGGHPRLREMTEQKLGMFSLVSYNLDRFREFVFGTKFLQVFSLSEEERERLAEDETVLLNVGMKWLKFVLLGKIL